jgi:hypothetical protein
MMEKIPRIIIASLLIGILLHSCTASALRLAMINYSMDFERYGTAVDPDIAPIFSVTCYGHSFLNAAGYDQSLNTTTENPLPLKRVFHTQANCDPKDCHFFGFNEDGDPERSEWCELSGMTWKGDPFILNITPENLRYHCGGQESFMDFRRCLAKSSYTYPCDNYRGSRQLHCRDREQEDYAACMASFKMALNQSNGSERQCEFHFNLPSAGMVKPVPGDMNAMSAVTIQDTARAVTPGQSLWCSIVEFFWGKCK